MNIFSVSDEVRNSHKLSNMVESMYERDIPYEREEAISNYKKIINQGSSLTKEILDRIHHAETVLSDRKRKHICGYQFKAIHIWMLAGLLLLFVMSFIGTTVMWFTNQFDDMVKEKLVIRNGTEVFESWLHPSGLPMMKVHIFNYTNVEDFETGRASKLHVEDVGPFAFQEYMEKLNPVFNNDSTLSYEEKRSYKFMPQYSEGHKLEDNLIVPNMPMLGAVQMMKNDYFVVRLGLSSVFKGLNAKPFLSVPAEGMIWGYDDKFFNLVRSIMSFQKEFPYEHFGILAHKNKTKSSITISTGEKDINTIGEIVKYNEETRMDHWSTEDCNRLDGTDGAFFGPDIVRSKKPISIYARDLCRKLLYVFEKEHKVFGYAPSYRYKLLPTLFAEPSIEPANQCFCHVESGTCPPHGVFNATPCSLGPAYISFPHFLRGDPALREPFIGLHPDEEKHSEYMDIHPTLGFAMAGVTKLQINMVVSKVHGIDQTSMFPEEQIILPVAWFDVGLTADELPEPVRDVIYRTSVTVPRIELTLKYGLVLLLLVTTAAIVALLRSIRSNLPVRRLERNVSGLSALLQ